MGPLSYKLIIPAMLIAVSSAGAQTTAPTTAPVASTGSGMGWLWIILLLALAGGAAWYFGFRNKSHRTSSIGVDRDRLAGSAQQAKGAVKDAVGGALGDSKLQAEGKLDKVEGKTQNTAGGVKDTLRGR